MSDFNLKNRVWWNDINKDLKDLLSEAVLLLEKVLNWEEKFYDYSFIVFPAAKAYEGFLKDVFLDEGLISEEDYYGKRFRIGKALNPSLKRRFGKKTVYEKIIDQCGGKPLADEMWMTWKNCRNLLFHWFPKEKNAIDDINEARERVMQVLTTMDMVYKECKMR